MRAQLELIDAEAEITLEANPGTIERGRFADYRGGGDQPRLARRAELRCRAARAARPHPQRAGDTERAVEELQAAGLTNFNLDLMFGLPQQSIALALADIDIALALQPAHLSHYQLTMEPGTVFGGRPPPGLPDDESSYEMQQDCQAALAAAGYLQYETSAYARPGAQCAHNLNYWNFGDYVGVGAGAHGKLTDTADGVVSRTVREREPRRYLARGRDGPPPTTRVPSEDLPFEFMMNALRLVGGFESSLFESRTGLGWDTVNGPVRRLAAREPGLMPKYRPGPVAGAPTDLGQRISSTT